MIWSAQSPKRYYGSTKQTLSMRMGGHRRDFKQWSIDGLKYCSSYDVLCFDDAKIEWVETVEFTDRAELNAREGWWMRNNDSVNKQIAGRSIVEWRADHKEETAAHNANYRAMHKEKLVAYGATYYAENKEKINANNAAYNAEHREEIVAYKAAYYVEHKKETAARSAAYRAEHKEEMAARNAVKTECLCGSIHTRGATTAHNKSKKHLAYLATL